MAPNGGRYRQETYATAEVVATTSADPDTDATSNDYGICKCCGQRIRHKNKLVFVSTPTKVDSFFERAKRFQPQNLSKTHHWKHKNKPKF